MNHLEELYGKLNEEMRDVEVSSDLEAKLLKEFDRRRTRRRVPFAVAAALAAGAIGTFWPKPKVVAPPQPPIVRAVEPVHQPVLAAAHSQRARIRRRRAPVDTGQQFFRIPYSTPLEPYERAEIVRMELPVAALTAAGFRVATADTGARAQADVVIGEDGMAHAVRIISILSN